MKNQAVIFSTSDSILFTILKVFSSFTVEGIASVRQVFDLALAKPQTSNSDFGNL